MKQLSKRPTGLSVGLAALAIVIATVGTVSAGSVSIVAIKDNTLYDNATGSISNGSGERLFVGTSGVSVVRRAVFAFDVAGNVPAGAAIDSATLTLDMVQSNAPAQTIALHRLNADWGEAASDAAGGEGGGAAALSGDATWLHTFFDTDFWTTPGGDFVAGSSASAIVGSFGLYTWGSNAAMVVDVQLWLDNPGNNFGWIAISDGEDTFGTAKAFASRENPTAPAPTLTVEFTETVCGDGLVGIGEECDDGVQSATCDADCTFAECGDGTTNPAAGEECDDGNVVDDDSCQSNCTFNPEAVPTVSEWGLILMTLLLLSAATALFGRRSSIAGAAVGSVGAGSFGGIARLFDPLRYARMLGVTLGLLLVGFAATLPWLVEIGRVDITGALLCAPVVAYLLHLWAAPPRE